MPDPTPRQAHVLSVLAPVVMADLTPLTDLQLERIRDAGHNASTVLLARAFKIDLADMARKAGE